MIFPVGDSPNPPGTPLVTYVLIGVNVAVYLLVTLPFSMMEPDLQDPLLLEYLRTLGAQGPVAAEDILHYLSAYDLLVYRFGFRSAEFSLVSLFTSLFLHGGFLHLAGNMLFLWIFGDNVENRLGRLSYLGSYLFFGIAATLFFSLFSPDSQIPLVGASGAISGVLGCYYLWFPRNRVRCFFFLFPFLMTTLMVPARIVLAFYLLIDNLLPFVLQGGGAGGVAHGAHIGGFVAGLGLAVTAEYGAGLLGGAGGRSSSDTQPCTPATVGSTIAGGDLAAASLCYLGFKERSQRQQVPGADVLTIGGYLLQERDYPAALSLFRRFIAERQTDPGLARAYLGAGYALVAQPRHATSAYHYFLAALDLAESEELADEARRQLRRIEQRKRETA
ncbi:MAG: rhomboid family intramembrane serine protease [Desulfuromonadales bacterium]|nr:rhomboid family intramembrane serine protease [Desulfuromonadales bacterium]